MRKILLLLAAAMTIGHAKADEGMWTMYDLDSLVYKQMVAEGFEMSLDDLYKGETSLREACIKLGFLSGDEYDRSVIPEKMI